MCSVVQELTVTLYIFIGFDDVIYPLDYKVTGHIVDDDMHDIMYS
jgi:hypothetical protein